MTSRCPECNGLMHLGSCTFCHYSDAEANDIGPVENGILFDLIDRELDLIFQDNEPQREQPSTPGNIVIEPAQVNDALRLNEWMKEILNIAYGKYPSGTKMYVLRTFAEKAVDDVSIFLKGASEKDPPPKRFIVDKEWTEAYWKVTELLEHIYGRYVAKWFETKPKHEWKKHRMLFYINAWYLGSMYRHGKPALSTSPWLTGERKGIAGDPFDGTPIGEE